MLPNEHARLAPSAAHRWFACPGSVNLVGGEESPTSTFAEEGTIAHAIAEKYLSGQYVTKELDFQFDKRNVGTMASEYIAELEHEDFALDEEFVQAVRDYCHVVAQDWFEDDREAYSETRIYVNDECHGTIDFRIAEEWGMLIIYDLKFGKGIYVSVQDNPQAMIYLLGASKEGNYADYEIVIVQPRWRDEEDRIRRLSVSQKELDEFENLLMKRIGATKEENAPLITGDHCQFCPAKLRCPELENQVVTMFEAKDIAPDHVSNEKLAGYLEAAPAVHAFLKAIVAEADERLSLGQDIPRHKRVATFGNRKWKPNAEKKLIKYLIPKLGSEFAENLYCPTKLITPAQAEKLIPTGKENEEARKKFNAFIATQVLIPETGVKVVPDTDKRPALGSINTMFDDKDDELEI